ncbi:hypothetical protein N9315_02360 [Alphaproteobacteria bacterium]|nr:hypothetical protein [Alphaproteobacteria bacterium]
MMINFGNRYSLLVGLIGNLHDIAINEKISTDDNARFFRQIASLGRWLFFLSIILMIAAMFQFTIEIQIANSALDAHLSDLAKHQE